MMAQIPLRRVCVTAISGYADFEQVLMSHFSQAGQAISVMSITTISMRPLAGLFLVEK